MRRFKSPDDFFNFWATHVHRLYAASSAIFSKVERVPDSEIRPGKQAFELPPQSMRQAFKLSDFKADLLDCDRFMQDLTRDQRAAIYVQAIILDVANDCTSGGDEPRPDKADALELAGMDRRRYDRALREGRRKILSTLTRRGWLKS